MNPQPEKTSVFQRYSGETYLNYEVSNEENFFTLGKLALADADIDKIEKKADAAGARRVLEIGCATGALLNYLRQRGWETQGVEISAAEAEYARKKYGLNVSSLPLEENKFEDDFFTLVNASHLIEHLNSPRDFVREVRRVLQKGGVFLVTTPNVDGLQAKIFREKWRSAIFDHLYLFSKKTLRRLLEEEGFKVELCKTWGGIAKGSAPDFIKKPLDKAAKLFNFGDVVLYRAVKL